MFITRPEYSVWLPRFEGYENASGWGAVELSGALPLYVLEVQWKGPRGRVRGRQTFLLSSMRSLADALASLPAGEKSSQPVPTRVTAHYPPGWDSASNTWRSVEIVEIWDAQAKKDATTYDLWYIRARSGEESTEPSGIEDAATVHRYRRLYRAPALA